MEVPQNCRCPDFPLVFGGTSGFWCICGCIYVRRCVCVVWWSPCESKRATDSGIFLKCHLTFFFFWEKFLLRPEISLLSEIGLINELREATHWWNSTSGWQVVIALPDFLYMQWECSLNHYVLVTKILLITLSSVSTSVWLVSWEQSPLLLVSVPVWGR